MAGHLTIYILIHQNFCQFRPLQNRNCNPNQNPYIVILHWKKNSAYNLLMLVIKSAKGKQFIYSNKVGEGGQGAWTLHFIIKEKRK